MAAFARSTNAFGLDLYTKLRGPGGENVAISPASIGLAFSMTWAGARGETAEEMARSLHLSGAQSPIASAAELLDSLSRPAESTTKLSVANRLFVRDGYQLVPSFVRLTQQRFGAPVAPVDFGAAEEARGTINRWVAERTQHRIPELLPADSIDANTSLVLANTIYFSDGWMRPFPEWLTSPASFYVDGKNPQAVPMMHQKGLFRHLSADGAHILELPYAGQQLSMLLVLPDERDGLSRLEEKLTVERIESWLSRLAVGELDVAIPRFELRGETQLSLPLQQLGMKLAFRRGQADFSGIAAVDHLYLGEAFHEVSVKVDEKGTEATAATAVGVPRVSASDAPPEQFIADHPFLFLIRQRSSGIFVFLGRVVTPTV